MKAARSSRFGGPEVLEIVDLPDPHPSPGEVRIAVRVAGNAGRALHALADIGELIRSGRFVQSVVQTYPLAEIVEAHRVGEARHVRGKIVLLVG